MRTRLFKDFFLFSFELEHISMEDIYESNNKFFTNHGISWEKWVRKTTNGGAAMSGDKTEILG